MVLGVGGRCYGLNEVIDGRRTANDSVRALVPSGKLAAGGNPKPNKAVAGERRNWGVVVVLFFAVALDVGSKCACELTALPSILGYI